MVKLMEPQKPQRKATNVALNRIPAAGSRVGKPTLPTVAPRKAKSPIKKV